MKKIFWISVVLGAVIFAYLFVRAVPQRCGRGTETEQVAIEGSNLELGRRIAYECPPEMKKVYGVVLHYTDTDGFNSALNYMESKELFVQIMIDKDGKAYQLTDKLNEISAGATGANSWAINIEIVGHKNDLLNSARNKDIQFQSVVKTVKFLVKKYDIPVRDFPPEDRNQQWAGIFSHQLVDSLHPRGGRRGKVDPGADYMRAVMQELHQ